MFLSQQGLLLNLSQLNFLHIATLYMLQLKHIPKQETAIWSFSELSDFYLSLNLSVLVMISAWRQTDFEKPTQLCEFIWITQIFVFGCSDAPAWHPLPCGHQLPVSPRPQPESDHWRVPRWLWSQGETNPWQCLVRGYDFFPWEHKQRGASQRELK